MTKSLPITCTLNDRALAGRRQRFSRLLAEVLETRRSGDNLAFRFAWSPAVVRDLGELVALESECFGFVELALVVSAHHEAVWVRVSGSESAVAAFRAGLDDIAPYEQDHPGARS